VLVGHSYGGMIITETGTHPRRQGSCLCSGHATGRR
jgi:pimeloyl-ACP methyl ester carboxylesterase